MWCWRRMEKMSWTDHTRNEAVLQTVKEEKNIPQTIKRRKANWICHILQRNCPLKNSLGSSNARRLLQHKCFDLVRYFFRVPPCPLTQDFLGPKLGESTLLSQDTHVGQTPNFTCGEGDCRYWYVIFLFGKSSD